MAKQLSLDLTPPVSAPYARAVQPVPPHVSATLTQILQNRRDVKPNTQMHFDENGRLIVPYSKLTNGGASRVVHEVMANPGLAPFVFFEYDGQKYPYHNVVYAIETNASDLIDNAQDPNNALPIIVTPPIIGYRPEIKSYSSARVEQGGRAYKLHLNLGNRKSSAINTRSENRHIVFPEKIHIASNEEGGIIIGVEAEFWNSTPTINVPKALKAALIYQ
jgi:hypothetical protein